MAYLGFYIHKIVGVVVGETYVVIFYDLCQVPINARLPSGVAIAIFQLRIDFFCMLATPTFSKRSLMKNPVKMSKSEIAFFPILQVKP